MTELAHAVFLSYASQDTEAARRICEALRATGVEVWFDQSELRGGDAWDHSIRRQIKTCALFIPVVSRHTRARDEGYFRLEWKLAIDRSHLMAATKTFLLPVVIDDTRDDDEGVPERFREVQWTRLPEGLTPPAFAARVARLLAPLVGAASTAGPTARAAAAAPVVVDAPAAPSGAAAAGIARATTSTSQPRLLWITLTLLVLAIGFVAADRFLLSRRALLTAAAPSMPVREASTVSDHSIAVLPFLDMSEKRDQEYFSDGLAEELLDLLAKTPGLHVIARTSSFYFKGKQATVPEIARTLGVANILEGSVRKSGNRLRITTQLVRADNGEHLWSETYDRDQEDVFKIQDDIARAVVAKLRLTLLGGGTPAADTVAVNPQAHNLYLQGRYVIGSDTAEDLAKAGSYFQKALDLEPAYAPAWAGLAHVALRQVANGYVPVAEGIARADTAARKAVTLDPGFAGGYIELGLSRMMSSFDWTGAREAFDHALLLEPSNNEAQFSVAHLTMTLGNTTDSLNRFQQLLERDPLNLLQRRYVARMLYYAGRLDEAESIIRQLLEVNPSFPAAHYELGRILLARGQVPQAMSEFETEKSGWRANGLPLGYHAEGRTADAQGALQSLVENSAGSEFQVAEAYAYIGNTDAAFAWLDRAVESRDPGIQWLRGDPLLRSLTQDPRYATLLRRLNLSS
ncbi:MAG TPA: TIR domain-containing protein [Steroidobacteraceae bacterium]|nr:TIR domain-containing protein [Steroidobacteraceae bacterium]